MDNIYQIFVNGGIGAVALGFAFYIFKTFMDQMQNFTKSVLDEMKEHDIAMAQRFAEIVNTMKDLQIAIATEKANGQKQ